MTFQNCDNSYNTEPVNGKHIFWWINRSIGTEEIDELFSLFFRGNNFIFINKNNKTAFRNIWRNILTSRSAVHTTTGSEKNIPQNYCLVCIWIIDESGKFLLQHLLVNFLKWNLMDYLEDCGFCQEFVHLQIKTNFIVNLIFRIIFYIQFICCIAPQLVFHFVFSALKISDQDNRNN